VTEAGSERIQKVLSRAGVASRRTVEQMIENGRIRVNDEPARLGQRIDPTKDVVKVDGSRVPLHEDLVHYMLNKPAGVVATADDPEGRPTVVELVDPAARVWPVGRLDLDSEGLILLTNDGELTLHLTHPRYGVAKTYVAEVEGSFSPRIARALERGIELDDGPTAPARVKILERSARGSVVELVLHEGRNRQVRRMAEAVGHRVRRLHRSVYAGLGVGGLAPGEWRELTEREVERLRRSGPPRS